MSAAGPGRAGLRVFVNGDPCELPDGASVEEAVRSTGAEPSLRGLAAAVDGEVVPRGRWTATPLRDGQRIEVLQAVQGG